MTKETLEKLMKLFNMQPPGEGGSGNNYNFFKDLNNIAAPEYVPLNDASRQRRMDEAGRRQQGLDTETERNLASVQDPTRNVNNRSARDTLRYSRLVNAYNTTPYFRAGVTATSGAGGIAAGMGEQAASMYQAPHLETAETRGQQRNESYEQTQRQAEIARREGIRNLPLETERSLISDDIQRAMWEAQRNHIALQIPTAQYNKIIQLTNRNPALATFASQIFVPGVTNPDPMTIWWQGQFLNILKDAQNLYTNSDDQMRYVFNRLGSVMGNTAGSMFGMGSSAWSSFQNAWGN